MPDDLLEFQAWMERLRAGDEEQVRRLVHEYGPRLCHAVRRWLHHKLRSKFDSRDFVQDVWASFFTSLAEQRPFPTPAHLLAYLNKLARNKVVETVRQRLVAEKWNVNREQSLGDPTVGPHAELVAPQPTPSTLAMSREEWQRLLGRQPPVYRRILLLFHEGKTSGEIARELRVSDRLVRRVIDKVLPGADP
jgi:RNA polymerase sigma-70 factor (ECF subfamily)